MGSGRARLVAIAVALAIGGLVAAVAVLATRSDRTQAAAPPVHSRAPSVRPHPGYLFVTDGHAGTLVSTDAKVGEYDLTLTGVHPTATYFLDRPGNEVGVVSVSHLLAGLFGKPGEPKPNAVVNALVPQRGNHQYTMGVALLNARYTPKNQTLVYHVRQLRQGPSSRREGGRTDVVLPGSFSHTSVFIDDAANTCTGSIENLTNVPLPQAAWPNNAGKWSTDTWSPYPADTIAAASLYDQYNGSASYDESSYLGYETYAPLDRGCHNWVNLTYPGGTIQVSLTDPWSGSNTANCDIDETDANYQFKCGYRIGLSTVGGGAMNVDFVICSANAAYQAWNASAPPPNDGCSATDAASDNDSGMYWFSP